MTPQSFIFIGRYGAGKGTQAKLLIEALKKADQSHGVFYIETGAEFRKFMAGDSYTAKHSKKIVEAGDLMPEFMCVYVWGKRLVEEYTGSEHIVFDGTPRKLLEAKILESLAPFYRLDKPWVIYLDVEHEESIGRLKLRSKTSGRVDDGEKELIERQKAFEEDVVPTIEWYKTNPNVRFLDIDGERTIGEVHADIVEKLGLV
jgi:adenylate kinase family enzyme